jgi:hypothetical protein
MGEVVYKFTRAGARSPFTGFRWRQGEWVEAEGDIALCANGIHACRVEALFRWVDDELWRVEVDDVHAELEGVVVARRARLVDRVSAWDAATSRELARSCARRAREIAEAHPATPIQKMADDIAAIAESPDPSATALSMYCAAHAADEAGPGGYAEERRRQLDWLRARLAL